MIERVLSAVVAELNASLTARFGAVASPRAVLGPVPDSSKEPAPDNPLTLSLVRIEEERVRRSQPATRRRDEQVDILYPEVNLNIYLLVSVQGSNYADSLKFLSTAVLFFQSHTHIDPSNCPGLDESIERIAIELCSQTFEEQNQLWGALSTRYIPSVLYRLRMITFQGGVPLRSTPVVQTPGVSEVGG